MMTRGMLHQQQQLPRHDLPLPTEPLLYSNNSHQNQPPLLLDMVLTGDSLEIMRGMPANSVNITITSPPYNKQNRTKIRYDQCDDNMSQEDYVNWQLNFLQELYRITTPGGYLFYNHKNSFSRTEPNTIPLSWLLQSPWCLHQEIVWSKGGFNNPKNYRFFENDERIWWLYKTSVDLFPIGMSSAKLSSVWNIRGSRTKSDHPATFPVEIPARILLAIQKGTVMGGRPVVPSEMVVFDPFNGSSTTLVAAKLLGFHFLGIELSEKYAQAGRERLDLPWDTDFTGIEKEKSILL